jgi:hypothetical protein
MSALRFGARHASSGGRLGVVWRATLLVGLALLAPQVHAQTPNLVASGAGSFAGGVGLSLEAEGDADQIAALEQQAFREFRWDVLVAAEISLAFEVSAADAATAQLMISADGETFQPLPTDQPAQPGQVVSLLISQPVAEAETGLSFPASDWLYEIAARPLTPPECDTLGPILLPIAFGDDLGCDTPGCGEGVEEGGAPAIAGTPNSEPGAAPPAQQTAPTSGGSDRELARELQTELARVGCYTIAVDGLWGPGSRRAMAAFNTARQADLPVESPSARALVAVARETGTVCEG